jgi:transcriptional regulator with XRE-family HTH domain
MGERLLELRRQAGLTQEQLARAVGVTTSAVRRWERARRRMLISSAVKLCDALGVTAGQLVGTETLPGTQLARKKGGN